MTTIVVAMGKNREIGVDNQLLWHLPKDLKHFKELTSGHPIIMGRKTYESIGRPLPNRRNIVLSKDKDLLIPGCEVFDSVLEVLGLGDITVIGGEEIYKLFLPFTRKLELTVVLVTFSDADTFFPELYSNFVLTEEEKMDGFIYRTYTT